MSFFKTVPRTLFLGLILAIGGLAAGQASAASLAVTVTSLNLRAGPSTQYPVVIALPAHADLTVYGCTAGTTWCDVSWGGNRGWVAASYIQVTYDGRLTVVTPAVAPALGLTVVVFNQAYWNSHYVGRPWYGNWNVYYRPGPYGPPPRGGAVAGCNDRGCAGVAARPGHVATGHCVDGVCTGTSVRRGPAGNVRIRHGSISN
ncbi:SH3 domain-containing protein [Rhizobium halophytocola]|uniref:Uncharacterized protein YraI n=1 Tax=Rhizobium halophytocola TaxID=735519 RepID=A0ABS4DUW3_9HYPH|nr:SH3 domain-containing protein [Rhizobium halophytocola]MBP1849471.1 uncharacterized protein YraI [Rhizobium halophytocola]